MIRGSRIFAMYLSKVPISKPRKLFWIIEEFLLKSCVMRMFMLETIFCFFPGGFVSTLHFWLDFGYQPLVLFRRLCTIEMKIAILQWCGYEFRFVKSVAREFFLPLNTLENEKNVPFHSSQPLWPSVGSGGLACYQIPMPLLV